MADVRELLRSTTPEVGDLLEVDHDAVARRGTRRRVGKRIGATALVLAVLGGSLVLLGGVSGDPDLQIVDQPEEVDDEPDGIDDQPDEPDDEIDDEPHAGDWEALPPGPLDARQDPFVAALDDGRIVVAGGSAPTAFESWPGAGRTDGAVLSADRTSWTPLPDAPFAGLVEFTARGSTLWARKAPNSGDPALADFARLARLDLDAPDEGWDELPVPPVQGVVEPVVTVFDDTVVVFGATIETATGRPQDVSVAGGAVWRDGSWTAFPPPPRSVTGAFLGVDRDHVAVVGGQSDGEVIADTAILDLATATWRPADPMPAGPRTHTDPAASAIVVDGRMFVAGGFAELRVVTPHDDHGPPHVSPTPCPPDDTDREGSAVWGPVRDMDCGIVMSNRQGERDETAAGGEASSTALSSSGSRLSVTPEVPATGAAWLDLATGTWEEVQLPIDQDVLPHAGRPDSLTAPTILELTPRHPADGTYWRLDAAGEFIQFELPDLPFPEPPFPDPSGDRPLPDLRFTDIELDSNGEPALAVTRTDSRQRPDRSVAVPDGGGGLVEATIPEPLVGVTYILIDGQLHAFGGIPSRAARSEDFTHDFERPLLARVLQH